MKPLTDDQIIAQAELIIAAKKANKDEPSAAIKEALRTVKRKAISVDHCSTCGRKFVEGVK